jgi:hypothetical protein
VWPGEDAGSAAIVEKMAIHEHAADLIACGVEARGEPHAGLDMKVIAPALFETLAHLRLRPRNRPSLLDDLRGFRYSGLRRCAGTHPDNLKPGSAITASTSALAAPLGVTSVFRERRVWRRVL